MQGRGNFKNGLAAGFQHDFCLFYPSGADVLRDANSHLGFEAAGEVTLGISQFLCQQCQREWILHMKLNVSAGIPYHFRMCGIFTAGMDTPDEIFQHLMVQRAQITQCGAFRHTLNIAVTHSVSNLRTEPPSMAARTQSVVKLVVLMMA